MATKEAIVGKQILCPISGQPGECPFIRTAPREKSPADDKENKENKEPTKVQKVLQRGSELCSTGDYVYAELSYAKAVEIDPLDWRGHYGRVVALQQQGKHFKAFQACQRGCEQLPGDSMLVELKEFSREEYKRSKEEAVEAAKKPVKVKAEPANDCPGSLELAPNVAPVSRPWTGRTPNYEERKERKELMLNIFREQWARIGKAKETMGYADYTSVQQEGLKIEGGHRPLPRPKGIELPTGFRSPIGIVTADHLAEYYNCGCPRLLISIHGDIFDVSDRPDKYGKDAPYYHFSGHDITWGLVTGNDTEHIVNMFFDLFKMGETEIGKKMQCICSWTGFYEVEYGKAVGRLAEFEEEDKLPAPPVANDDECCIQ